MKAKIEKIIDNISNLMDGEINKKKFKGLRFIAENVEDIIYILNVFGKLKIQRTATKNTEVFF